MMRKVTYLRSLKNLKQDKQKETFTQVENKDKEEICKTIRKKKTRSFTNKKDITYKWLLTPGLSAKTVKTRRQQNDLYKEMTFFFLAKPEIFTQNKDEIKTFSQKLREYVINRPVQRKYQECLQAEKE